MSTAITPGPVAAAWLDAQVVSTAIMRSAGALAWLDAQVVSTAITPGPVAAAWLDAQVVTGQLDLADIPLTYPPFRNPFAGRSSVDAVAGMGSLNCHNALGDRTALSPAHGLSRLTSAWLFQEWGASIVSMRWVIEQRYRRRVASRD